MKRLVFGLVMVLLMIGAVAGAETTTINVSTPEDMVTAQTKINAYGGEYTIILLADMESSLGITNPNAIVTLVGNGHTMSTKTQAISVSGGVLNLGDGQTELIIAYTGSDPDDNPGLVFVNGESGTCNMKDKVTIRDSKKNNYLGAGVTVQGGTFHMYGGTIQNCGVEGGSVCYGGGVAVYAGGKFIMDGGVIDSCYVTTDYGPVYRGEISAAGGGVFVSGGGNFEMNGGIIKNCNADFGAGVALVLSYGELYYYQSYGILNSIVTINGGEIISNNANSLGGGIFASGYFYAYTGPIGTVPPGIGINDSTGLYVKGGKISENDAYEGGGIFLIFLKDVEGKQHTQIHNATISGNRAVEGAGLKIFSYWTALELKDSIITGNIANKDDDGGGGLGGGIMLYDNTDTSGTKMLGTNILCNNKADTMGADVYVYNSAAITLTSASAMNQIYLGTRFMIDGWYDDTEPRWSETSAAASGNTYLGDTYQTPDASKRGKGIIAAFTAYDEIQITKTWDDTDNILGKRPESLTFTLTDASGSPVKLRAFDETTESWTASGDDAKITLTAADADSTGNVWTGTIAPLLVNTYSDTTSYLLKEEETGDFYQLKAGDPSITFTADKLSDETKDASSGIYDASFTNTGRVPVTIDFFIHKEWIGVPEDQRPEIRFQLYQNGVPIEWRQPEKLSNGTYIWRNLPKMKNGEEAVYSAKEMALPGFETKYSNPHSGVNDMALNGGTVTNYKVPKTGDPVNVPLLWLLVLISFAGLLAVGTFRRRKGKG